MRMAFTEKEYKIMEKKIVASLTPEDMGWMLRHFPDEKARRTWMGDIVGIPGPIQSLLMLPALKKWNNKWTRLLEELKKGERIAPQPSGCLCF